MKIIKGERFILEVESNEDEKFSVFGVSDILYYNASVQRQIQEFFEDTSYKDGDKPNYTFQCFYIPLDKNVNNIKGKAGVFGKNYSKGRSPEKIIEDEINSVLNFKEGGINKYRLVINSQKGISRTPKNYLYFFKYLALSLSSQYSGWPWDNVGFIERTNVDYTKQRLRFNSPSELQKYLEHLFVEYLGPNDFIEGF